MPTLGTELEPGAIGRAAEGLTPPEPVEIDEFPAWPKEDRRARRLWLLRDPYRVTYELDGALYQRTVWASEDDPFAYDGASVPRITWSVVAEDHFHLESPFHDEDYRRAGKHKPGSWRYWDGERWQDVPRTMSRKESDRIFRLLAKADPEGPGSVRAATAYRMLRTFGGGAWHEKDGPAVPEIPQAMVVR